MSENRTMSSPARAAYATLLGVSAAHFLNDAMQSVLPAVFPLFRDSMHLSFAEIGWVAFTLNVTASILQPLIGAYTDKRPLPILLPLGMAFTLAGMVGLALTPGLWTLLLAAALIGIGSSVLHPESSRVAHLAAGRSRGFAQSVFQVGGNAGQAIAPLLVAFLVNPLGQRSFLWLTVLAAIGIWVQLRVSRWYRDRAVERRNAAPAEGRKRSAARPFGPAFTAFALGILILMLFSKFVYLASMTGYYSFYFMDRYGLPLDRAQICLFALQFAGMAGTFAGGPLADRFGRKKIIWFSIFGTAPFSLLLPHVGPNAAVLLCLAIGFVLMSGFSVIIVYAQELLPGSVGTVAGLFFGLSFGLGGLGSVALGSWIDAAGVSPMIRACAFLPLLGAFALFLPRDSAFMRMKNFTDSNTQYPN